MPLSMIEGDVFVTGSLSAQSMNVPANAVGNAEVEAAAGIEASKLQHQYGPCFSQASADATAEERVIHVVKGATGTIVAFRAGFRTAPDGSSSCDVDLKKNGTTILTAEITLDDSYTAYQLVTPAGFTSTSLVAGDVLSVQVKDIVSSNPPEGVFAQLVLREDAQ